MGVDQMEARVREIKDRLGKRLIILGHHYQKDEVFQFADFTGDSLKLAQLAAGQKEAQYIVFCGVHFMAETADILTAPDQQVILPDLKAGCSMADMADDEQVEACWEWLQEEFGDTVIPVTYVNSSAAIKAFCGAHGGLTCTSSNAQNVFQWAFKQKERLLFLPDEHLGRNTAARLGIPLEEMAVYNPLTGQLEEVHTDADKIKVILWKGFCSVHQHFKPEHVRRVREKDPQVKVLVHPECSYEVVQAADDCGSTEYIIRQVKHASPGTRWAIGTEVNLVQRLANQYADQKIKLLNEMICPCLTMNRIDLPHLLWSLEQIEAGQAPNRIVVDQEVARLAKVALDRMLALS
jgi:quinolinate synthase